MKLSSATTYLSRGISPAYDTDGVVVLNQKCIRDNKVDLTLSRITNPDKRRISDDKYLQQYDVVVNSTGVGTLGRVAQIKQLNQPMTVDSHVTIVRPDLGQYDALYFGYAMFFAQSQIERMGDGATGQTELSRTRLGDEIDIPDFSKDTQKKIGVILGAYDDLIENNSKRIERLEAMAHLLYRHYFEAPETIERVLKIGEAFDILGGGTPSKSDESLWAKGDINWYTPSDLTKSSSMFMDESSTKINQLGLKKSSAKLFDGYSIMMTSRATIGVISINTTPATTNQGFITCVPNDSTGVYYLYYWLKNNMDEIEGKASGTTFKEISKGVFKTIDFAVPKKTFLRDFESKVKPITSLILALQRKNQKLVNARNLLLPRLMSGEIKV